jgi:competence protein ComEA
METKVKILAMIAAAALLIGWYIFQDTSAVKHPIVVSTPISEATPTPTATATPTPAPLRVHVAGAVQEPGVYTLPPHAIVDDALQAAGGPTTDADLGHVNLAVELQDQQQVYILRQGEIVNPPPIISGSEGDPGSSSGGLVNINTATAAELETLPRVGPSTAQKIIAYRETNGPFSRIEDIQNVPGIGPATFDGLKDLITVQ